MSSEILLKLENLTCAYAKGRPIFSDVDLTVKEGDVIAIVGRSGGGKTTLLKCVSHMTVYDGNVLLWGRKPAEYGIPNYRTQVLYVPQRPSLLPSTPKAFIRQICSYGSRKKSEEGFDNEQAAIELGEAWSLSSEVWERPWTSLSGGEAQRAFLAIACTLKGTEILLLDAYAQCLRSYSTEPTSALDSTTAHIVETHLASLPESSDSSIKAILWITHSEEQTKKATRLIKVAGAIEEQPIPEDA
ncbi:hypothetical protein FRC04_011073 [Tulasnella sp. 424]|nr:hypothetical protein FRC04_011073 [Tulasnella sp. 424]